jgi:Nitronate monooxygenase
MDVEQARRAVDRGADIIVAQGGEAGGHSGYVGTLVLVPQVVAVVGGPARRCGGGSCRWQGIGGSALSRSERCRHGNPASGLNRDGGAVGVDGDDRGGGVKPTLGTVH